MTSLIARMIEAGTPADIIEEVAMLLAEKRAHDERKRKDRDRKRHQRHSTDSEDVHGQDGQDRTGADPAPPPPFPPDPPKPPPPHPDGVTTRARNGRIPGDWKPGQLPPSVKTLADLWPPGRIERELDGFRDFWLAKSRDYRRENWDRVWWNRIRDIHERVMRDSRNDRKPSDDDQIRNPYARVAARQAAGVGQSSG